MFVPLQCGEPGCRWKSKPKHKRPQQALTLHRNRRHGDGITEVKLPDIRALPSFLVTFASGEERHVLADSHQETMDRHWFFGGGALRASFKRRDVAAVEAV